MAPDIHLKLLVPLVLLALVMALAPFLARGPHGEVARSSAGSAAAALAPVDEPRPLPDSIVP